MEYKVRTINVLFVENPDTKESYYLLENFVPGRIPGLVIRIIRKLDETTITNILSRFLGDGFEIISDFRMSELEKLANETGKEIKPEEDGRVRIGFNYYSRINIE